MSIIKGAITKQKGKSKVRLTIGTGKKKIEHAKWVEFQERLKALAKNYGISVKHPRAAKKRAPKK